MLHRQKLIENLKRFTPDERKIASFITNSPDTRKEPPSPQLAQTLGVRISSTIGQHRLLGRGSVHSIAAAVFENCGQLDNQEPHNILSLVKLYKS